MGPSLWLFSLLLACGDKDCATTETRDVPVVTDDAPGQRLVLGVNGDTPKNGQIPVDFDYAGGGVNLNNAADDRLIGVSAAGAVTVIDPVTWDERAGWPMAKGSRIELADDGVDATDSDATTAWCLATALTDAAVDQGSPGEPSSGS
jgi:hypothetical protein